MRPHALLVATLTVLATGCLSDAASVLHPGPLAPLQGAHATPIEAAPVEWTPRTAFAFTYTNPGPDRLSGEIVYALALNGQPTEVRRRAVDLAPGEGVELPLEVPEESFKPMSVDVVVRAGDQQVSAPLERTRRGEPLHCDGLPPNFAPVLERAEPTGAGLLAARASADALVVRWDMPDPAEGEITYGYVVDGDETMRASVPDFAFLSGGAIRIHLDPEVLPPPEGAEEIVVTFAGHEARVPT